MADRTLSVKLLADIQGYVTGMDRVASKTRETTRSVEQNLADQRRKFEQVGAAAMAIGGLAALGIGAAIARYAEFDQAMSNVQAATHETTENMALLREAALEAGASTVFSATEAAAAIEELSKAGVATADILSGGLQGALDLAAAGGIGVAEAAETAASAMTQFGLAGDEVTHIADLLAAGAGKAQGGVSEMGQALNQAGLVSAQMGLSIEETVGSLTAFASAGLIGSDAGTSFRAMLLRLANPTKESQQLMDELGLSFYDAQGAFIGVEGLAGQLQERLAGLTQEQRNQALAQIFGQDAIRTSAILYEQGAEGVREWTDAVDDQGYAADTAATRLDNLRGDLEALSGAFETALIGVGEGSDGALRGLVQGLTNLVEAFTELPAPTQQAIGLLGGVVAVVGLVGGGALVAVPKIVEFRTALQTLGVTAATTRATLGGLASAMTGPVGIAVAAAAAGFWLLDEAQRAANLSAEEWAAVMERGATATDLFAAANSEWIAGATLGRDSFDIVEDMEQIPAMIDRLNAMDTNWWEHLNAPANVGLNLGDLSVELDRIDTALARMSPEDAAEGFRILAESEAFAQVSNEDLLRQMPQVAAVLGDTEESSEGAAEGIEGVGSAAEVAAEQAGALYEQTSALNDLFFDSQDGLRNYEQAVDDIAEALTGEDALVPALTEAGDAFDLGEESGRAASEMLDGLVQSAQVASEGMHALNGNTDELAAYQDTARQRIYDTAIQMGLSEDAAREYADRLTEIPDDVSTSVSVDTTQAEADLNWLARTRTARVVASVASDGQSTGFGSAAYAGVSVARATGGIIPGPPSSTDNIIAALATGEYVVNAAMTSRYLPLLEAINSGRLPGYATGGYVRSGYMQAAPVVNVAGSGGGAPVINQTVQPTPGMSERAVAELAGAAIAWALR